MVWDVKIEEGASDFFKRARATSYAYYRLLIRHVLPSAPLDRRQLYQTVTMVSGDKRRFYFPKGRLGEVLLRYFDSFNEQEVALNLRRSALLVVECALSRTVIGGVNPDVPTARNAAANEAVALLVRDGRDQILHIEVET